MSSFYIQKVQRPRGPRWLVASRSSADFAVFDDKRNAEATLLKLTSGEAKFCPTCGHWIIYKGSLECPQYFLADVQINDELRCCVGKRIKE